MQHFLKSLFHKSNEIHSINDLLYITIYLLNQDYNKFIKGEMNKFVYERFQDIIQELIVYLKNINYTQTGIDDKKIISEINKIADDICQIMRSYLSGKVYDASLKIVEILNSNITSAYNMKKGSIMFRGREADNNFNLYNREEMFHIPLNKRGLVKEQRFSLYGFPCLYLGNSVHICWEELGKPDPLKCNYSSLKLQKDINVLDLCIPHSFNDEKDILRLPIIIACSLATNKELASKEEYIFPQLILSALINDKKLEEKYYAIRYNSTQLYIGDYPYVIKNELYDNAIDKYINYVIPVKDALNIKNKYKLCEELCNTFHISYPLSIQYYQLFSSNMNVGIGHEGSDINYYENTLFGMLETMLTEAPQDNVCSELERNPQLKYPFATTMYIST